MKPKIAVISFPGTNGDTENLRTFWRCGMDAFVFRWNDSRERLADVDGYFIGSGFSYEDRGRAGMVAGRDPIFQHLHEEAQKGKVIVGSCNGCQVLVESELIPLGSGLNMCMARNVKQEEATGFLNEWIWMTSTCKRDRCATSDWEGVMQIPIAHGEGRFTTKDRSLMEELKANDQIAFSYCDAKGMITDDANPNGSLFSAAGICNHEGNVVAIMPHPERTPVGDPYFISMRKWIESGIMKNEELTMKNSSLASRSVNNRTSRNIEIFIDTIIVNNEERTVEQAARKIVPSLKLKQLRYISPGSKDPKKLLSSISIFNPNKEMAYIRRDGKLYQWNADTKSEEECTKDVLDGISLLRRDEPDTGSNAIGEGSETGICYACSGVDESLLTNAKALDILGNPHASTLEKIT